MSHSVKHKQIYLDLYQQQQDGVASRLHSNLAQPIVAAKNFAAAIMSIKGEDPNLQEARELAGVIFEMTDQAYTVAYDLMREAEQDVEVDSCCSMQSAIERYGISLRLSNRGVNLVVVEDLSLILMDSFLRSIVLNWIKTLLIYLLRNTNVSNVDVKLQGSDAGLSLDIVANIDLKSEHIETAVALTCIRNQLKTLTGTLCVDSVANQTSLRMVVPPTCETLMVIK
jgi:hypothetical protein